MNFKFLKFSIFMTIAMVVMSACKDDDTPVLEPQPEDLVPFAMTYVDFITPNDVQILSADTTSISVSKEFAQKMGIKFFKDRAVTIWRTIGTAPFIRIITDAQENKNEIILTTTRGEFSDMFENLDASLVTDLYVNKDYVASRSTRNRAGEEVSDVSDKYMDNEGVYHPAVIIVEEGSPAARSLQSRTGSTKNYFTAEELLEQNASFDVLNVQTDFKFDHKYPTDAKETEAAIHLKGKVGLAAKLSGYADINISWFKLKRFEAGMKGSAGVSTKLSLGLQKEIKKEWETEIMPVGGHLFVFWVGPIPVPLVYESSINHKTEAKATASVDVLASGKYEVSFSKGVLYERDKGWSDLSQKTKTDKYFRFDGLRGSAKVEASSGIYYQMGIYLGNSMGPEFSFGPYVSAEAEVATTVDGVNQQMKVEGSVGAYAGLAGEIGAEINVLCYKLAKWSTTFDVFKFTLFEGGLTWTFTPESWGQLEAEWNHVMNKGSHEWDFSNSSKAVVPYRLPEQGMNF